MSRLIPAVLASSLLLASTTVRAADGPVGSWKLTLPNGDLKMLFAIEGVSKDGKWSGKFIGSNLSEMQVGKLSLGDLTITADAIRFTISSARVSISFDGKLPPDAKTGRILGSVEGVSEQTVLAHLEPSKLTTFDPYALDRETLEQSSDGMALANAAISVFTEAGAKNEKIENLRGWADKTYKSSEPYGLRWQRFVTTQIALALTSQKGSYPLAIEYAHKAERLVDDTDPAELQLQVLKTVAEILTKAGKAEDAKQLAIRFPKLEEKDWIEYQQNPPVKPAVFAGRKGKSDKVVLFELFTGAECPPCVAADVAFDALEKTYKPNEIVLLEYHVHVPGPDPLTNADSWARLEHYKQIQGTPTAVVDGKPVRGGGGPISGGSKTYALFCDSINADLEKNADAKIELSATRQGANLSIKANVSDLAKTGEKIRLRFVLVEDHIRYAGGNGQRFHHCVVRSFPGGLNGFAMTNKSGEQTAKVNLDELRSAINSYLDKFVKEQGEFPRPDRPLSLKGLRVVAFIQDDATNDVLQAAQVEIKE